MAPISVFTIPSSNRVRDCYQLSPRKRKRTHANLDTVSENTDGDISHDVSSTTPLSVVYTSVLTPLERSQKRLAGLPLDQATPLPPFPHASSTSIRSKDKADAAFYGFEDTKSNLPHNAKHSLHAQHLAVMFAILHRSIMSHDYARARRALGLILRNEIGGRPIDIRSHGLWTIGAEILSHFSDDDAQSTAPTPIARGQITQDKFERSKSYYETLIVQYPVHKTWPDAINSIDFCLAMFQLWIYVIHQDSIKMRSLVEGEVSQESSHPTMSFEECGHWEAVQADRISRAMDERMKDVIFRDNPELRRLRHMVATWSANLLETSTHSTNASVE